MGSNPASGKIFIWKKKICQNVCGLAVPVVVVPQPHPWNAEICPGFPPPQAALHIILSNEGDAVYRNDPKFSDRYAWANSSDPDQTAPLGSSLIRVYTVCHSVCIVWTHYSMVEPQSSNFRGITTMFLGVRIFRKFTVDR